MLPSRTLLTGFSVKGLSLNSRNDLSLTMSADRGLFTDFLRRNKCLVGSSTATLYSFPSPLICGQHCRLSVAIVCQVLTSLSSNHTSRLITLRAKFSGTVNCNRSCLWVCVCGGRGSVTTVTRNCVHRSSPN